MYSYINSKKETELQLEEWSFIVIGSEIILDNYYLKKRATKRHKFQIEKDYNRIIKRGYGQIKVEEVPISDELKAEVKQKFIDTLKVVIDKN